MSAWRTFRWGLVIAAGIGVLTTSLHGAQVDTPYRDPGGRFTALLPAGWSSTQLNASAVQFSSESTYVTLMVLPGTDATSHLRRMASQVGAQWKNWTSVRQGDTVFGGRPGTFTTFSGLNPKGSDSYLQLIAAADSTNTYLLMTSSSKNDFLRLKAALNAIEKSVALLTAASRDSGSAQSYRMRVARLVDKSSFEQPMTALSVLLPSDWSFTGAPIYMTRPGCPANLVRLAFKASSPDGRVAIELMPLRVWQTTDNQMLLQAMQQSNAVMASAGGEGCAIGPAFTAEAFLRRVVVPEARPGSRMLGSESMPDAISQLRDEAAVFEETAARQGMPLRIRGDAARVRLAYSLNGQPVEEWMAAMVVAADTMLPTPYGNATYSTLGADHILAARAPQGQLDQEERLLRIIMSSIKVDPRWQWRVQQTIASMQMEAAAQAGERARTMAKAAQETARIIHETYQNSTRSREHSMEGWSQYMRGVQPYRNSTNGDTVDLPTEFGHAWAGPNGQFIVTDSATMNPNQAMGGNWTKLEPVRR